MEKVDHIAVVSCGKVTSFIRGGIGDQISSQKLTIYLTVENVWALMSNLILLRFIRLPHIMNLLILIKCRL